MLTAQQFMAGSKLLATAARVREEHAKSARVQFDRAMYAQAAEQLHGWATDLERWSKIASAYEDSGQTTIDLQTYSDIATRFLAQLRYVNAGVEA